jgi:hypothetical protein
LKLGTIEEALIFEGRTRMAAILFVFFVLGYERIRGTGQSNKDRGKRDELFALQIFTATIKTWATI